MPEVEPVTRATGEELLAVWFKKYSPLLSVRFLTFGVVTLDNARGKTEPGCHESIGLSLLANVGVEQAAIMKTPIDGPWLAL
jgi:hypothetical protein